MDSILDIVLLVLLGFAAVSGFFKGLITMLTSLLALVLGVWATMKFSHIVGGFIQEHLSLGGNYITILSFVLTFILVVFGVQSLGKIVASLAESISLGFIDKILGAVFGVLKCAFILSVLFAVINGFELTRTIISDETKANSFVYNKIAPLAPKIFSQLDFNLSEHLPIDNESDVNNIGEKINGIDI